MKQVKVLLFFVLLFTASSIYAHDKTDTIRVSGGNCENCKQQIEKTLKVEGIIKAEWNAKNQLLIVTYASHTIRNIDIQKKIAEAGYDTEKQRATDEAYNKLEACCKYRKK
ncbi:MAG: cation transporter [Bacteroidota bacterium]